MTISDYFIACGLYVALLGVVFRRVEGWATARWIGGGVFLIGTGMVFMTRAA